MNYIITVLFCEKKIIMIFLHAINISNTYISIIAFKGWLFSFQCHINCSPYTVAHSKTVLIVCISNTPLISYPHVPWANRYMSGLSKINVVHFFLNTIGNSKLSTCFNCIFGSLTVFTLSLIWVTSVDILSPCITIGLDMVQSKIYFF